MTETRGSKTEKSCTIPFLQRHDDAVTFAYVILTYSSSNAQK